MSCFKKENLKVFPTVRSSRYIVFDRKSIPIVACGEERTKERGGKNRQTLKAKCLPAPSVVAG